ncbi:MAG: dihydrodipicolinate synthase family protein [Gammaproteobacteria bacterium]
MFDDLKNRLHGCFYTIFTPFSEDESIDFESLEKYLDTLYRQGARRFYAMAYNSRYSQMKHSEIMELNAFCIRFLKDMDKENIVIVGDPIHCSTSESIEFTRHAKENGADLISLIVREKYFTDEQILDHFAQVGNATGMAILVHEMPFLSGYDGNQMHWPKSLMMALPKVPQIVALKEDAKDFEVTKTALELEPRIRVIIAGIKKSFMSYKPYGARAYLNGISIIDARIGEMFWKAYEEGDDEAIDFILRELEAPFFGECAAKYGWHRTNKALLQAAGFMHRRDRMPLKHLSDAEFVLVQDVYARIKQSWDARLEAMS